MKTFREFMIEAKDETEIGAHTGKLVPKKQLSAAKRHEFEKTNLGQFRMIYPVENAEKAARYEELIAASQESWEDFNYGKRRRFQGLPA